MPRPPSVTQIGSPRRNSIQSRNNRIRPANVLSLDERRGVGQPPRGAKNPGRGMAGGRGGRGGKGREKKSDEELKTEEEARQVPAAAACPLVVELGPTLTRHCCLRLPP